MKQENKELLLKDLCGRLPHGVKCKDTTLDFVGTMMDTNMHDNMCKLFNDYGDNYTCFIMNCKPYLFPLSSMTEEQKKEYNLLRDFVPTYHYEYGDIVEDTELCDNWRSIDYLIVNHFDYRGLIPMGLALDATGLNIY